MSTNSSGVRGFIKLNLKYYVFCNPNHPKAGRELETHLFDQIRSHESTHISEAEKSDIFVHLRTVGAFRKCDQTLVTEYRASGHLGFFI